MEYNSLIASSSKRVQFNSRTRVHVRLEAFNWQAGKARLKALLRFNPLMDRNMVVCYVVC